MSIKSTGFTSFEIHSILIKIELKILCAYNVIRSTRWLEINYKIWDITTEENVLCVKVRKKISKFFYFHIFIFNFFQTNDPSVAINLILILREAIQAKTSWRGSTLVQILKVNATEAVGKLLVRVHKMQIMQHQPLADHILICMFWILSALATKGKKSYSDFNISYTQKIL